MVDQRPLIGRVGRGARRRTIAMDVGRVGERQRHSRDHARPLDDVGPNGDPPPAVATAEPVEVATSCDPVRLVAIAGGEQVVGLTVRGVTVDLAAVVEQVVMRRHLPLFVHRRRPPKEIGRAADEIASGDDGVGVEGGQE